MMCSQQNTKSGKTMIIIRGGGEEEKPYHGNVFLSRDKTLKSSYIFFSKVEKAQMFLNNGGFGVAFIFKHSLLG